MTQMVRATSLRWVGVLCTAAVFTWISPVAMGQSDSRADRIAERLSQRDDTKLPTDENALPPMPVQQLIDATIAANKDSAAPATSDAAPAKPASNPQHPVIFPNDNLPLGAPSVTSPLPGGANGKPVDTSGGGSWLMTTFSALAVVIGLIYGMRFLLVKATGTKTATASSPVVEVLSRISVAPRQHVLLLRLGGRVLLVSDSGNNMRTLTELTDPDEVAQILQAVTAAKPHSMTQNFTSMLGRFNTQLDEHDDQGDEQGNDQGEVFVDRARDRLSVLRSRLKTMTGSKENV